MQKETGRWKIRWKIRDLLADGRCGQAVLDFLSSTDVGRLVLPLEESDAGSEVSEWELRELRERGEEREVEAEELGAAGELGVGGGGRYRCSYPRPPSWHPQTWSRIVGTFSFALSFVSLFAISLVRATSSWDRPGRRAKGELAMCRHRADCGQENCKMYRHDL